MLYKIRFTKKDRKGEWLNHFAGYTFLDPHTEYAFCKESYSDGYGKDYKYKRGIHYIWIGQYKEIPYPLQQERR